MFIRVACAESTASAQIHKWDSLYMTVTFTTWRAGFGLTIHWYPERSDCTQGTVRGGPHTQSSRALVQSRGVTAGSLDGPLARLFEKRKNPGAFSLSHSTVRAVKTKVHIRGHGVGCAKHNIRDRLCNYERRNNICLSIWNCSITNWTWQTTTVAAALWLQDSLGEAETVLCSTDEVT